MSSRQLDNMGLKLSSELNGEKIFVFSIQRIMETMASYWITEKVSMKGEAKDPWVEFGGKLKVKGQVEKEAGALYAL